MAEHSRTTQTTGDSRLAGNRVIVVGNFSRRGIVSYGFGMGVLVGIINFVAGPLYLLVSMATLAAAPTGWLVRSVGSATIVTAGAVMLLGLPASIVAASIRRRVGHARTMVAAGTAFASGTFAPGFAAFCVSDQAEYWVRSIGTGSTHSWLFWVRGGFGVAVGVSIFVFTAVWAAHRVLGRRVIEQSGRLCWTCAYDLGSDLVSVCPECGKPFDPHDVRGVLRPALERRLRAAPRLVIVVTVALVVSAGYRVSREFSPLARVLGPGARAAYLDFPGFSSRVKRVYFEVDPDATKRAVVAGMVLDRATGRRVLQLFLGEPSPPGNSPTRIVTLYPLISATLTPEQTARVFKEGLPPSLRETMFAAIRLRTQFNTTDPDSPRPPVPIDPAPHFEP